MIVGITGFIASGKDAAANFFVEKGYKRLSLSDEIREDLTREGKPHTRENETLKAIELRETFGNSILAKRVVKKKRRSTSRMSRCNSFFE